MVEEKGTKDPGNFFMWFSHVYSTLRSGRMIMDKKDWERIEALEVQVPCDGCDKCCRGPYAVHVMKHERKKYDQVTWNQDDQTWEIPRVDGECVYLGKEGCTIHKDRPYVCRMFDCRTHMVVGIGDPNNKDMREQWNNEEWFNGSSVLIIGAMRTAAAFYMKKMKGHLTSAAPIVEYAFSNFPTWIGAVSMKIAKNEDKSLNEHLWGE